MTLENRLITEARRRTLEERRYRAKIRADLTHVRQLHQSETRAMRSMLRQDWIAKRTALTEQHQSERADLAKDQSKLGARFMRIVDVTGRTRKRQDADKKALQARQKAERGELVAEHKKNRSLHSGAVKSHYTDMKREVAAQYRPGLRAMLDGHRDADKDADRLRQDRATEREQAERRFEEKLRQVERMQRRRRAKDRGPGIA